METTFDRTDSRPEERLMQPFSYRKIQTPNFSWTYLMLEVRHMKPWR